MWTWKRFDSLPYPGPQTSRRIERCVKQLALVPGEDRRMSNWWGVRCTSLPSTLTSRFSRSTASSPISTTGSPVGVGARRLARSRASTRRSDRLRHVVVGAGVQRRDLLVLVADRREDDHRRRAPGAQLAAHLGAGSVREMRSRITAAGGRIGRRRERSRGGLGGLDVVSGGAQARPQRAQDLTLVVHDEDARARRSPDRLARSPMAGRVTKSRPDPEGLGPHPPAVGLREPARDREPEAGAVDAAGRSALERREDAVPVHRGHPGPLVDDAHEHPARRLRRAGRGWVPRLGRSIPARSRTGSDEHPLDLLGVDHHRQRLLGELDGDPRLPASPSWPIALREELVHGPDFGAAVEPRRPRAVRGRAGCRSRARVGSASPRIVATSSRRSSWSSSRSLRASAPLAEVRIAISGLRRSWLTARRTAVLTVSLRRSVSASMFPASEALAVDRDAEQPKRAPGRRRLRAAAPPGRPG